MTLILSLVYFITSLFGESMGRTWSVALISPPLFTEDCLLMLQQTGICGFFPVQFKPLLSLRSSTIFQEALLECFSIPVNRDYR